MGGHRITLYIFLCMPEIVIALFKNNEKSLKFLNVLHLYFAVQ